MAASSNKSGDVSHIHHKESANRISDLTESLEVDSSGVSTCAGNDELGLVLVSKSLNSIVVDHLSLVIKAVGNEVEIFTGEINGRSVSKVSAVSKALRDLRG